MDIVLVILALVLVTLILMALFKRDRDKPQTPTQPPTIDPQYPEIRLLSRRKESKQGGPDIQLMSGQRKPKQDDHTTPPPIPDKIMYPFDYSAPWWRDYSHWVREQKGWCCDECGISLKDNHEMLHTHHTIGQNVNLLEYLEVLCIGCHAEQSGKRHRQIKKTRTYKRFMEKYDKEWRSRCEEMGFEM